MQAHEIFSHLSPASNEEVLGHLQRSARPTFRVALETLAGQQRLRPVFIERKPRAERYAWLGRALARPGNDAIAANVLQMWLVGAQVPLLCDFLDSLGIPHDGKGSIEDLPACPEPARLRAAVDAVLAKGHAPEHVGVYLRCFTGMDPAGWAPLAEMVAGDERLRLGEAPVTP